ncbi:MAG TPA: transglutaminase domain-containing protein [Thermomicrobiales bacterium]|jgi:transglutaminase-like putative cysteine protease/cytochrome b561|nr:transglutaminase domain-containing protein [Thermomicrobiales bacterium]
MAHRSVAAPMAGESRLARMKAFLRPAEGIIVVLLQLVIVLAAAWSVIEADWVDGMQAIPAIVVAGSLIGLVLAKAQAPDLASHLTAFWLGLLVVVLHTAIQFPQLGESLPVRLRTLALLFEEWTTSMVQGERMDDRYLFVILLGLTGWLVAYMSGWTLYRRGWVTASVLLPGAVIMINLGYRPDTGAAPLVLYVVAAGSLVVAHFAYRRRWDWQRRGLQAPSFISSRIVGIGFNAVLIVTVLAWILPFQLRDDILVSSWRTIEQPIYAAQQRIEDLVGDFAGEGRNRGGSYAAFDDSFDLGGSLDLSQDPMLAFEPESGTAPYLAARRLDYWDGYGWRSTADETFDQGEGAERTYSSRITYQPDQNVALGADVLGERVATGGTVRVLSDTGDQLFTRDTYVASDEPTSVQLSWISLDGEALPVGSAEDIVALPLDLRSIATLLQDQTYASDGQGVLPVNPEAADRVTTEQETLADRLIDVDWVVTDGRVGNLIVSGPVPVYDDVVSVTTRDEMAVNDTYEVSGLASEATAADLRAAGTDYPEYIVDRYLQLPTTTTERTRQLANEVVNNAGADNPYDMAVAIQNDLRERILYTEDPPSPPSDQDAVDFVLFDSLEGYCEYYASAMTVMLRDQGIPSRVVTGFFPPDYDPTVNQYIYREANAHVWVEAYFPGYGWIPFEPTANRTPPDYATNETSPSPSPSPSEETEPSPSPSLEPSSESTPPVTPETSAAASPSPSAAPAATTDPGSNEPLLPEPLRWALLIIAALLLVMVVVGATVWLRWRRELRGLSPVSALYARAVRLGSWLRVGVDPMTTPAEYADRIGRSVPAARQPVRMVVDQYAREQYAPPSSAPSEAVGQRAWLELRRALVRALPRRLFGRR